MTITRTPACTVKGCPAPRDPDFHIPICGHGLVGHHHHVTKRSQGGKDGPQVFICPDCHEKIDSGPWGNDIKNIPGRGDVYFAWDLHGNTLIERTIGEETRPLSDGAEAVEPQGTSEPSGGHLRKSEASSAPSPSAGEKEEGDGQPDGKTAKVPIVRDAPEDNDILAEHGGRDLPSVLSDSRSGVRPERSEGISEHSTLTHEQRVAIARKIKNAQQRRQFPAGDYANAWEEELNEDFWNLYANEFGYTYPSLRNVMRVCKRIPQDQRHDEMSFAHHEAVKTFDIETRDAWLERAFEEEWPVKRLREELVSEGLLKAKKKTKRWGLEELWALLGRALDEDVFDAGSTPDDFLSYLEEQG